MAPKYLTTCAELPANKPAGYPHLLDCSDATALQDFTFADAMATILYNWKPEALRAFLDLSKDKFVFKIEQAAGSTYVDFIIGRTGNTVMFGGYKMLGEFEGKELYDWNFHVRYEIAQSGKWLPRYAIGHGFGDGLFGLPESSEQERYDHSESDLRDAIWVTQAGYMFSNSLIRQKKWLEEEGVKRSMTVEAKNQETPVPHAAQEDAER